MDEGVVEPERWDFGNSWDRIGVELIIRNLEVVGRWSTRELRIF